jgi:hypothetical protein
VGDAKYAGTSGGQLTPTIGQHLDSVAANAPNHHALIVPHQNIRWSYAEFVAEVDRFATGMLALGIQNTHLEEPGPAALGYPTKTLHGRQKRFFTERPARRNSVNVLNVCVVTPRARRLSGAIVDQSSRTGELRTQAPLPRWHHSYSVHSRGLSRPVGSAGTETPVQSNSILLQDWGFFAPNSPFRRAVVPGSANPSRNQSKKPTIRTATETSVDQAPPCSPLS